MKKEIGISKHIILLLSVLLILTSCGKEEEKTPRWDVYNPRFVDFFSNDDDIEYRNISQLTAYYYEDYYYYVAIFTHEKWKEDFVYEVLYLWEDYDGVPGPGRFYPIKYEEECYEYFPDDYKKFLAAKENGASKTFTQDEISKMINDFYGREIK